MEEAVSDDENQNSANIFTGAARAARKKGLTPLERVDVKLRYVESRLAYQLPVDARWLWREKLRIPAGAVVR
jgi:hypothetical protein